MQKWNWNDGFPTIDDVCPQPINRFQVSLTFYNLIGNKISFYFFGFTTFNTYVLVLQKRQFVILVEKPETMELQYIKKGNQFK